MRLYELALALAMPLQLLSATNPGVTLIPFDCVNKLVVIQAETDGIKGFFILDTGTPDLTLNNLYFQGDAADKVFYGIMGYEFLSHYRVAINFRKKEIYIWDAAYVQEQLAAVQK